MSVEDWYADGVVLVTGGTGYLGKLLIEKILYTCHNVRKVYLLARDKKGLTAQQRLEIILKSDTLERVRREWPERLAKVEIVSGDMRKKDLGLREEDVRRLALETTVVFHGAASVRFDDPLHDAVQTNIMGTDCMLRLAATMQNLKRFVMISTAYTNCDRKCIEERLYPAKMNWRDLCGIVKSTDQRQLASLTKKLLGNIPNTYVFTKSIIEHMADEAREEYGLPVIICRPSIVYIAESEPSPGYVESLYGPYGLTVALFTGLTRTLPMDQRKKINQIPSDHVIRALLLIATRPNSGDETRVYNLCSTSLAWKVLYAESMEWAKDSLKRIGVENIVCLATTSKAIFNTVFYLNSLLPAVIIDRLFVILRQKPMVLKVRRRVYLVLKSLAHFMNEEFEFETRAAREAIQEGIDHAGDWKDALKVDLLGFYPTRNYIQASIPIWLRRYSELFLRSKPLFTASLKCLFWLDLLIPVSILSLLVYSLGVQHLLAHLLHCIYEFFFSSIYI